MKLITLFLSILFTFHIAEVKSQSLHKMDIFPSNPTDQDSIMIIYEIVTAYYSYILQDSTFASGNNIEHTLCLHITDAASSSLHKDTLHTGKLPIDTYQFSLTVYNSSDTSNNCIPKDTLQFIDTFIVASAVSIEEMQIKDKLRIYPNPVRDILIIESKSDLNFHSFSIQNVKGKKVNLNGSYINQNSQTLKLNIESLNSGMYILILQTNEGELRHKFMVQ